MRNCKTMSRVKGKKIEYALSIIVFALFFRHLYYNMRHLLMYVHHCPYNYDSWEISDWLINYEGGFVRRGLLGQLLYYAEDIVKYDIRTAIMLVTVLSSCIILYLLFRIFRENGWSPLIIPTGFCLGFTCFNLFGRRDLLSLLLSFCIFWIYKKVTIGPQNMMILCVFYVLSVFQILMHEASFFYTFPILMLFYFMKDRTKVPLNMPINNIKAQSYSFLRTLCFFSPILITMLFVCIYKGNQEYAESIWYSWNNIFEMFPQDAKLTRIGEGVQALAWDAKETFSGHLMVAYMGGANSSPWRIPLAIFNLVVCFFLIVRIDKIDTFFKKKKSIDELLICYITLVQFFFMLPLFTVLSCDWGRTIPYWTISTLFVYNIFKDCSIVIPSCVKRMSCWILKAMPKGKYTPYVYIILLLVAPVPSNLAPFDIPGITLQEEILHFIYSHMINVC